MRVLGKIKTCVAAFALGAIVITSSSMIAEALSLGDVKYDGWRTESIYGYRSCTDASGYDSRNGVPLNIGVKASLGGTTAKTKYGSGNVRVYSEYSGYKYDAQHWICKGDDIKKYLDYWVSN